MKLFRLLALVAVLTLSAIPFFPTETAAQTAVTMTSLSANVTQTATTIRVASATGFTASTGTVTYYAYVDRELMRITGVSGTTITVVRGSQQTAAAPHATGATVFVGSAASFAQADPLPGNCTLTTSQQYTPVINIVNGNIWNCSQVATAAEASVGPSGTTAANSNGNWQASNLVGIGYSLPYTTVTDAAYTAKLSDVFIDVTSITAGRTITLPAVTQYGKLYWIKHSGATAAVTVASSSGQYITTIGTTSTTISSGQVLGLISVGGGWATWQKQ